MAIAVRICARQARSYRVTPYVIDAGGAGLAREASPTTQLVHFADIPFVRLLPEKIGKEFLHARQFHEQGR